MEADLIKFIEGLVVMLSNLTNVPYAAALIVLLVSIVKRLPFLAGVSANVLHLIIQVGFWLIFAIVTHLGHGEKLQQLTEIATVIIQALVPLFACYFGAQWLYGKTTKAGMPLWGYKRS